VPDFQDQYCPGTLFCVTSAAQLEDSWPKLYACQQQYSTRREAVKSTNQRGKFKKKFMAEKSNFNTY